MYENGTYEILIMVYHKCYENGTITITFYTLGNRIIGNGWKTIPKGIIDRTSLRVDEFLGNA